MKSVIYRAAPSAFHVCCFYFSAVLVVRVLFPFGVWAVCGIRLYRFLIFAFLSTIVTYEKKKKKKNRHV